MQQNASLIQRHLEELVDLAGYLYPIGESVGQSRDEVVAAKLMALHDVSPERVVALMYQPDAWKVIKAAMLVKYEGPPGMPRNQQPSQDVKDGWARRMLAAVGVGGPADPEASPSEGQEEEEEPAPASRPSPGPQRRGGGRKTAAASAAPKPRGKKPYQIPVNP